MVSVVLTAAEIRVPSNTKDPIIVSAYQIL